MGKFVLAGSNEGFIWTNKSLPCIADILRHASPDFTSIQKPLCSQFETQATLILFCAEIEPSAFPVLYLDTKERAASKGYGIFSALDFGVVK